ncbi:MAG: hypothetical protein AAB932_03580 [Patescibacteria group bacterium]
MPVNLPPILPTRSSSGLRPNVGRAQDFSVAKLQQQKDIENAAVSMGQLANRQSRGNGGRMTSIAHLNDQSMGPSSAATPTTAKRSVSDEEYYDEGAERRRAAYVHGIMREKKAMEEAAAHVEDPNAIHIGTGSGYRKVGPKSFKKQLAHMANVKPQYRGSLSEKKRAVFEAVVRRMAQAKTSGSDVSSRDISKVKLGLKKAAKSSGSGIESTDVRKMVRIAKNIQK